MDSLIKKEIADDVEAYAKELHVGSEENNIPADTAAETITPEKKKHGEQHHDRPDDGNRNNLNKHDNSIRPRFLSNTTHESKTDPDARISVKPGKPRQLNYYGQIAVDDAHHVITAASADFADKRDSQCLENIVNQSIGNLNENEITLEQITTDTGYSSGEALQYIEEQKIDAYIPNFGSYVPQREGFIYNKDLDQYECQRGHKAILHFKGITKEKDGYQRKSYRSSSKDCKHCPFRRECCGKSTNYKKIDDSMYKPLYDKMHLKMQTTYAKRMSKIRGKTVEPVLGTLINFLNMKRLNTRGIRQANKHVMMAALCYNLNKLLHFQKRLPKTKPQAMEISIQNALKSALLCFFRIHKHYVFSLS